MGDEVAFALSLAMLEDYISWRAGPTGLLLKDTGVARTGHEKEDGVAPSIRC